MSKIFLHPLPYSKDALEPYISSQTVDIHYSKHHNGYISNLNTLIQGTELEGKSLEEIVRASVNNKSLEKVFSNAGQAWNHNLYWKCMIQGGGGKPSNKLLNMIESCFNTFENFTEKFKKEAVSHFGSGWIWVIQKNDQIEITTTKNADSPFAYGIKTLCGIDIWEHAYYLDYQNRRVEYIDCIVKNLLNWNFIELSL